MHQSAYEFESIVVRAEYHHKSAIGENHRRCAAAPQCTSMTKSCIKGVSTLANNPRNLHDSPRQLLRFSGTIKSFFFAPPDPSLISGAFSFEWWQLNVFHLICTPCMYECFDRAMNRAVLIMLHRFMFHLTTLGPFCELLSEKLPPLKLPVISVMIRGEPSTPLGKA